MTRFGGPHHEVPSGVLHDQQGEKTDSPDPTIARQVMDDKLAEPTNTDLYRKRQHSIEPVFGNIKANLGYRRFARRGLPAVNSEWRLICASHNMLKLRQARPA